jgi:hypothetical protein
MNKNILINLKNDKHNPFLFVSYKKIKLFTISLNLNTNTHFFEKCKESGITSLLLNKKNLNIVKPYITQNTK